MNFLKIRSWSLNTGRPETDSKQLIFIQNVMKATVEWHSRGEWITDHILAESLYFETLEIEVFVKKS